MTDFVKQNAGEENDGIKDDGPIFFAGGQESDSLQVTMNPALGNHQNGQRQGDPKKRHQAFAHDLSI
jgi:hypothetical protein